MEEDAPAGQLTPQQRVGGTIRRLRKAAGLTMVELAERAGLSQPFLSQIERGAAAPSLTTLYALAEVLAVEPSELLPATSGPTAWDDAPVIRASEGIDQYARVLVSGGESGLIEAYEHTYTPSGGEREWFRHPGEDFLYVLEGEVELQRRGAAPVLLGAGTSMVYDGDVPHRCVATSGVARCLVVSVRHAGA